METRVSLHHRDATVWDANQGIWVNSSSVAGNGVPVGLGVSADSGAANQLLLFPSQTIRDSVLGRIGTLGRLLAVFSPRCATAAISLAQEGETRLRSPRRRRSSIEGLTGRVQSCTAVI